MKLANLVDDVLPSSNMKKIYQKIVRRRHDSRRQKKFWKTANFLKMPTLYTEQKNVQIFCLFHVQYYLVCKPLKFGDPVLILSASN